MTHEHSRHDRWLPGNLTFYSETGTEGGWWAFEDSRFNHGPEFVCGSAYCPVIYRQVEDGSDRYELDGTGKRLSETHASYDGLYTLRTGDRLQIVAAEHVIYLGELRFDEPQADQYAPDAYGFGALVSHLRPPLGVDPVKWETWVATNAEARLLPADKSFPRIEPDLLKLYPQGHYVAESA